LEIFDSVCQIFPIGVSGRMQRFAQEVKEICSWSCSENVCNLVFRV